MRSGWKPAPRLEEGGDPAADADGPGVRLQDAADDLQQGALAGAVGSDEPDRGPRLDVHADVAEGPEVLLVEVGPPEVDDPLLQRLLLADDEALGDVLDLDDGGGGHYRLLREVALQTREHALRDEHQDHTDGEGDPQAADETGGGRLRIACHPEHPLEAEHRERDGVGQVDRLDRVAVDGARHLVPGVHDRRRPHGDHEGDLDQVLHVPEEDVDRREEQGPGEGPDDDHPERQREVHPPGSRRDLAGHDRRREQHHEPGSRS